MYWSRTLVPTSKETSAGVKGAGRQLLVRAGLARRGETGALALLPLGYRVLERLASSLRQALGEAGFAEVLLDSEGSDAGAAHAAAQSVGSYKQLPVQLVQLSVAEAGGARLDAHSFDADAEGSKQSADRVREVLQQAMKRYWVRYVEAGSTAGVRLVSLSPDGSEAVLLDGDGKYAATVEAARIGDRPWALAGEPVAALEKVHTPGASSVEDVCTLLGMAPRQILKTMVFHAESPIPVNWVVAVVQGDHQVNLWKLKQAAKSLGVTSLQLADSPELREKFAIGFVGPDAGTKTPDAVLIIDPDAAQGGSDWAAGANEMDYHVRHFNWFREAGDRLADPAKVIVADIRNAMEGDPSPTGGTLHSQPAIALGEINALGTELCEAAGALFDDGTGARRPLHMGSYRLNLMGLIEAIVESSRDEHGIIWPAEIAPCSVVLTPIKYDDQVKQAADRLHTQLTFEGIETILDDRDARAGFKFADADLIGFPIRITLGQKNVSQGVVELKRRGASEVQIVPMDDLVARVRASLIGM